MADKSKAAPPGPPETAQEPEEGAVVAVAPPDLPHRAWDELELVVGALREHWTDEQRKVAEEIEARRVAEVTDHA